MGPVRRKVSWGPIDISRFLVGEETGEPGANPWRQNWDRLRLSPQAVIIEVGGVIGKHYASLNPQGVQEGFFPRWSLIQLSTRLTSVNRREPVSLWCKPCYFTLHCLLKYLQLTQSLQHCLQNFWVPVYKQHKCTLQHLENSSWIVLTCIQSRATGCWTHPRWHLHLFSSCTSVLMNDPLTPCRVVSHLNPQEPFGFAA